MTTTKITPRRTVVVCHECGYPRTIRKVEYSPCPFCGAEGSGTDDLLNAKVVKIGVLKEEFFQSLQERKTSKGYRLQEGSGRRLNRGIPQEDTMKLMTKEELNRAKLNRELVERAKPKPGSLRPGRYANEKAVKVVKKQEVKKHEQKPPVVVAKPESTQMREELNGPGEGDFQSLKNRLLGK